MKKKTRREIEEAEDRLDLAEAKKILRRREPTASLKEVKRKARMKKKRS